MAITKVIKDLTEFNPGNPDYVLNATNAVTVINAGGNQYNFNGVYGKFGLRIGTTVLTGVPSAHPIAVLNNGLTGITYTGTVNQGTLAVGGITYTFYSGDVTITVTGNFGVASYYCKFHQYMGGQDNLVSVYSTAGLKMPTGAAYSGTTEDGMIRNDTDGTSQGSTSTMQHFNGTDWKNYENLANFTPTYSADVLVVAGGGGGGGSDSNSEGGGGGGAGGYRTSTETLTSGGTYNISVGDGGAGGAGGASRSVGANGSNSQISGTGINTITSSGGGGGGFNNGVAGGSGGGTPYIYSGGCGALGGSGNLGGYNPPEGNNGGLGSQCARQGDSGGGGGAGAVGGTGTGGAGATFINGTTYAGGGAGGNGSGTAAGGGGSSPAGNGTDGLGGGGGGGKGGAAGEGGSGIVIIRVATAYLGSVTGTGTATTDPTDSNFTYITYTQGTGTYVPS